MYVPIRHIVQGEGNQRLKNEAITIFFFTHTMRAVETRSWPNGGPRKSAKEHRHGAEDISGEKASEEAVTMVERESDETFTMSRADTISRTKGEDK